MEHDNGNVNGNVNDKLMDYPFDLYQRTRDITHIIETIAKETGKEKLRILDVGGFRIDADERENLLLKEFLPAHEIYSLDVEDSSIPGYIRGDGTQLPFKDKSFDVVVSSDVLEHIPGDDRIKFMENLLRTAKGFVVLGAPFYSRNTALAEDILFEYIRKVLHVQQAQLKEHIDFRLPRTETLEKWFHQQNLDYITINSGFLNNWLLMMMVKHYLMTIPGSDNLHIKIDRFYNMNFYESDHREPGYRKIFVAAANSSHTGVLKAVDNVFKAFEEKTAGAPKTVDFSHLQMVLNLEELRTRRQLREKEMIIQQQAARIEAFKRARTTRICRAVNFLYKYSFGLLTRGVAFVRLFLRTGKNPVLAASDAAYQRWLKKNAVTEKRVEQIKKDIDTFKHKPKISIIMTVYNIQRPILEKALESVINQVYENWELCIVDDASPRPSVRRTLERFKAKDSRIKIKYLEKNQGMSGASNEALAMAEGEFAAFMDHDDELSADALYETARHFNKHPHHDLVYSDEDKLTMEGKRCNPVFKPNWSPRLFLTYNYLCHLVVCRTDLVREAGCFREGFEGSQDYDLWLRVTELTRNVGHIPKVLYHWRMVPGSAAAVVDAKREAFDKSRQALREAMARRGIEADVLDGPKIGTFRVKVLK
jgi:SAM-dependent methyltransferase